LRVRSERLTGDEGDGLHDPAARRPAAGATAAVVAAGVLLTTVGLATVRTADPAPVDTPGSGAIPDRLHTPSPWLEWTEGEPPGTLAVIAGADAPSRTGWRTPGTPAGSGGGVRHGHRRRRAAPGRQVAGCSSSTASSPTGRGAASAGTAGRRCCVATEALRVDVELFHLVGWHDPDRVLVRGGLPGPERRFAGIYALDVRTGTTSRSSARPARTGSALPTTPTTCGRRLS